MLKALSVRSWICVESLWRSRATVMATNSAVWIACLSSLDFISMWVVVCVCRLTMDAPSVGYLVFFDPYVHMKLIGFHAAWTGLSEIFWG